MHACTYTHTHTHTHTCTCTHTHMHACMHACVISATLFARACVCVRSLFYITHLICTRQCVCLRVYMLAATLFARGIARKPVCLCVCMSVCLCVCLLVCLSACLCKSNLSSTTHLISSSPLFTGSHQHMTPRARLSAGTRRRLTACAIGPRWT